MKTNKRENDLPIVRTIQELSDIQDQLVINKSNGGIGSSKVSPIRIIHQPVERQNKSQSNKDRILNWIIRVFKRE